MTGEFLFLAEAIAGPTCAHKESLQMAESYRYRDDMAEIWTEKVGGSWVVYIREGSRKNQLFWSTNQTEAFIAQGIASETLADFRKASPGALSDAIAIEMEMG